MPLIVAWACVGDDPATVDTSIDAGVQDASNGGTDATGGDAADGSQPCMAPPVCTLNCLDTLPAPNPKGVLFDVVAGPQYAFAVSQVDGPAPAHDGGGTATVYCKDVGDLKTAWLPMLGPLSQATLLQLNQGTIDSPLILALDSVGTSQLFQAPAGCVASSGATPTARRTFDKSGRAAEFLTLRPDRAFALFASGPRLFSLKDGSIEVPLSSEIRSCAAYQGDLWCLMDSGTITHLDGGNGVLVSTIVPRFAPGEAGKLGGAADVPLMRRGNSRSVVSADCGGIVVYVEAILGGGSGWHLQVEFDGSTRVLGSLISQNIASRRQTADLNGVYFGDVNSTAQGLFMQTRAMPSTLDKGFGPGQPWSVLTSRGYIYWGDHQVGGRVYRQRLAAP